MVDPGTKAHRIVLRGAILRSSLSGKISEILQDHDGLIEKPNQSLMDLVESASREKLEAFLDAIDQDGYAVHWEINYRFQDSILALLSTGLRVGDQNLVLISPDLQATRILLAGSLTLFPELKDSLDGLDKEILSSTKREGFSDQTSLEEVTRINNDLVSLQREVVRQKIELEALNDLKSHFLGMAAHDLRNPLAAVLSYTEFLQDELGDSISKEHKEFLAIIESSSSYMLSLIEDVLDVSTISQGRMILDLNSALVEDFLEDVIAPNRILAHKKDMVLDLDCSLPDGFRYRLDKTKFNQVMQNLLSNAIKFSSPKTRVEICSFIEQESLIIQVVDQGPGIPAGELETIFDLYQRTSVVSPEGHKSTGLGLAIAKNIITAHGGELGVESRVGDGTMFTVSLPLNPDKSFNGRNYE